MGVDSRTVDNLSDKIDYPKLMIWESDLIVLFSEHGKGVVVNGTTHAVGRFYDHWDMNGFKDFAGQVILQNV